MSDPVVKSIVAKLYGEDPETGEGPGESVPLYAGQTIVSRETLRLVWQFFDDARAYNAGLRKKEFRQVKAEIEEALS